MRCDVDGNLWCGWGMGSPELDGVVVFTPQGKLIGRIKLPERCANVCFGGTQAEPPVHGGKPVGLFALCEYAGRVRRLGRTGREPLLHIDDLRPGIAAKPGQSRGHRVHGEGGGVETRLHLVPG